MPLQNYEILSPMLSKLITMKSIYLFGGRSELGSNVATEIISRSGGEFSNLIRIQRAISPVQGFPNEIFWDPSNASGVSGLMSSLIVKKDDLIIVAPGKTYTEDNSFGFSGILSSKIDELVWVNLTLPLIVISHAARELEQAGGGAIIVFTSAAAFPPQSSALIYSHVKHALDGVARQSRRVLGSQNVRICVVRSSFSATQLNTGRTPTPFSVTPLKVGQIVADKFLAGKDLIWVPSVFNLISLGLRFVPGLENLARRIIRQSHQNQ
jgi:hypothetical protein